MTKKICAMIACMVLLSTSLVFANNTTQKQEKPWQDWTEKEAEKILNSSPWSQSQNDTDTSEMTYSPTAATEGTSTRSRDLGAQRDQQRVNNDRSVEGATNQAVNVKFTVRFFSARPVRRALIRLMELKQKPTPDVAEKMHAFADAKSPDSIIITVNFETKDQRYGGVVMQAMNSAITATLKNETYLERDGKRLFLEEYIPPGKDGFGARFIFLRKVNDKPFIDSNSGDVRFLAKYPNGIKVDRRFKVGDMMYEGELEY